MQRAIPSRFLPTFSPHPHLLINVWRAAAGMKFASPRRSLSSPSCRQSNSQNSVRYCLFSVAPHSCTARSHMRRGFCSSPERCVHAKTGVQTLVLAPLPEMPLTPFCGSDESKDSTQYGARWKWGFREKQDITNMLEMDRRISRQLVAPLSTPPFPSLPLPPPPSWMQFCLPQCLCLPRAQRRHG